MRLELGQPVSCADGDLGVLADVVVDPRTRHVTHLVVDPDDGPARLVPAETARADDRSGTIALAVGKAAFEKLPDVEEVAFLEFGQFPADDPRWDIGIERVLVQQYDDYPGFGPGAMQVGAHYTLLYDRVPKGEVEIRRASAVESADHHRLGHVEGVLVDADERITHVVLERGHLFGRREVTIPIEAVSNVSNDSVTLALTKDEVGGLPAVPVGRWTRRRAGSKGGGNGAPAAE